MSEWKPIESAPTYFIGYEEGDFGPNVYGAMRGPFGDFKWLADPEQEVYPTHWMPLPPPPVTRTIYFDGQPVTVREPARNYPNTETGD